MFVLFCLGSLNAQDRAELTYNLDFVGTSDATTNALNRQVADGFKIQLLQLGKKVASNPNMSFLINAKSVPNQEDVLVVSVSVLSKMPDPIVALAKKEQVFYQVTANNSTNSNPEIKTPDAIQVREMLSEDFILNYREVLESKMYFLSKKRYNEDLKQITADLFTNCQISLSCK
jgi:hypothetical protein